MTDAGRALIHVAAVVVVALVVAPIPDRLLFNAPTVNRKQRRVIRWQ